MFHILRKKSDFNCSFNWSALRLKHALNRGIYEGLRWLTEKQAERMQLGLNTVTVDPRASP
jgi:hypothetical protein